jgi:class 3 adenylate cyclase
MIYMFTVRAAQVVTALAAGLAAILSVQWLAAHPEPVNPTHLELALFVTLFLARKGAEWSGYVAYYAWTTGLLAVTVLVSAALALALLIKATNTIAVRRLALALALGSFSIAYFFFVTANPIVRDWIGWSPGGLLRLTMDFLGYLAAGLWPLLLARFFMGYPRAATHEEWEEHFRRGFASSREALRQGSLHFWMARKVTGDRLNEGTGRKIGWLKLFSEDSLVSELHRNLSLLRSRGIVVIACVWAAAAAGLDLMQGGRVFGSPAISVPVRAVLAVSYLLAVGVIAETAFQCLSLRAKGAFDEDRRKLDWIRSALILAGVLGGVVLPAVSIFGLLALPRLTDASVFIPFNVVFVGPLFLAATVITLLFLSSLAASIFYRGAIDPRLAARKVTVLSVLGLLLTFLFILLERTVAMKISGWLSLSPDSGALIAGATVAATMMPVRRRTETVVTALFTRWLPLESAIQGECRPLAVAISDLSGYTALSSRDERQALLMAALLQRQAAVLTAEHGGRVVKFMGDAVLFAFEDAMTATRVLSALHSGFAPAARQLGLQPLQVHSGAHWGDVTVAGDGDIYGQTVNLAARIQASAVPGQIAVSSAFASTAGGTARFRSIGERQFKNVTGFVPCEELVLVETGS